MGNHGTGVIRELLNDSDTLHFISWLYTRVAQHSCRVENISKSFTQSFQKRHLGFTVLNMASFLKPTNTSLGKKHKTPKWQTSRLC